MALLARTLFSLCILLIISTIGQTDEATEIIFETETTTELATTHTINETTTTQQISEAVTQLENVTEIDVSTEDATEMMNSTLDVSTTTETSSKKSKKKSKKEPKEKKEKKSKRKKIKKVVEDSCHCDLTRNSCDVNCCCDDECTELDRSVVFTDCLNDTKIWFGSNLRYCDSPQKMSVGPHSSWLLDALSNSLFCVWRNNLPPVVEKRRKTELSPPENVKRLSKQHFSWTTNDESQNGEKPDFTRPYHFMDKIWILINGTLQTLSIPSNRLKIFCSNNVQVKYLENTKTSCFTNQVNNMKTHELFKMFKNITLISSPHLFNETWKENIMDCPKNVCLKFNGHLCESANFCRPLNSSNETSIIDPNNLITSIRFILISNGSEGFVKAKILFYLSNKTAEENVEQHFEVVHQWLRNSTTTNATAQIAKPLSGNPGYLRGKPLIVAKWVTLVGNATDQAETLDYFVPKTVNLTKDEDVSQQSELENYLMSLKTLPDGTCSMSSVSNTDEALIRFAENARWRCEVRYEVKELPANATVLCGLLEDKVYEALGTESGKMPNRTTRFLSTLGRPSRDPAEWIELVDLTSSEDGPSVSGRYVDPSPSPSENHDNFATLKVLECSSFPSEFRYEFAQSVDGWSDPSVVAGGKRVARLRGAALARSTATVKVKIVRKGSGMETLSAVGLVVRVTSRFYDAPTDRDLEFARGPNLHLTLPNDFFYPFTYSGANKGHLSQLVFVVAIIGLIYRL